MLKERSLILAAMLILLASVTWLSVLPPVVHADMRKVEIPAKDDTYIVDTSPNGNHGVEEGLIVGRYTAGFMEIWLRFDLSTSPKDLGLRSATLKLYRNSVYGKAVNVFVQVFSTKIDWNGGTQGFGTETTLTWNNKPEYITNYTASSFTGNMFSTTAYTRIPLDTSDVEYWSQTEDQILSLVLRSPMQTNANSYVEVRSKEEGTYVPYLELIFSSEGTETNSQVAVLVDLSMAMQTSYERYIFGVGKWLEWWKMDLEEVDLSSTTITRSLLSKYKIIVIPQFNLTEKGHLDSSEMQAIYQSVYEDGAGLVQIDAYLQGYAKIWPDYSGLFNVTVNNWVSTKNKMNLVIINNQHFITEIYRNGTKMNYLFPNEAEWKESDLVFENVTLGLDAMTLAVMPYSSKNYPAIIARTHGKGKVVLSTFSTGRVSLGKGGYDGFGERANSKTTSGMHGLLWRSIVWTAKKPFAFIGMPPFITFRVDDVAVDTYNPIYVSELLKYGFFVNLYLLQDYAYRGGTSYQTLLKNYYFNGSAHIGPHAWDDDTCIYWNRAGESEYPNSTLSKYFMWLDANYTAWNITPSASVMPHFYQLGANAVPFMQEREWLFTSNIYKIPYSAGEMSNCWIWDADWKRVAHVDYADENEVIFNVAVEMPVGSSSYAFQDCLLNSGGNPAKATTQILSSLEHGLADLFWAEAFTHEDLANSFSASNWDKILTWVFGNITAQYPFIIKASKEYIARYALNREQLSISNEHYNGDTLTLNFSGSSTLPMAFYLFTDQKISGYSGILDYFRSYGDEGYMVWVPPYSNGHQVTITLGDTMTNLPHIHFTTANITSTYSSTSQLVINAKPIWKHDKPTYLFEINCTDLGQPESITYSDGTPINFVYNEDNKIASFNKTLSQTESDIMVSWTDQQNINHWQMTFDHRDLDNNNIDSAITWELYKGSMLLSYTESAYTLFDSVYTLKTYYHGKLINQTDLDTASYGNTTIIIGLQMKSHLSVPGGFIAFNNTVASIAVLSETDENLTVIVEGSSPVWIIVDVPRNATYGYVQRNSVNVTDWNYVPASPNYIQVNSAALSKWEFYFPRPPPISVWQFTLDHIDLDGNAVDSKVTWELYNGSNLLSYAEGDFALLNGTYTLKTYYHGLLINQTDLDTAEYGNSTVRISLQMKSHESVSGGYIAFDNPLTSIIINSQTNENLTFTAEGFSPVLIIVDVPRNCSYIRRNDANQTGWIYVRDLTGLNYTYIYAAELSTWEYYFPHTPAPALAVFGNTNIGGTVNTVPAGYVFACRFQAPSNGTATLISAYITGRYQTGRLKAMIYSDVNGKAGDLLFESQEITLLSSWAWHNFSIDYNIQEGKYYWFAIFASVELQYRYDVGQTAQEAVAWDWTYPNVPGKFNGVYEPSYSNKADSIFITYIPEKT